MANGFRLVALNGLLIFLYVALGRVTFAASVEYGNVTSVIFAPEGVALAFSILFGPKIAPGIMLGQALLSYWSGPSLLGGLGIGLFNAFEGVLGGYLFRRWGLSRRFDRLRDVGLLACMIFLILQPISATGGVLMLLLNGMIPTHVTNLFVDAWSTQGIQKPLPSLHLVLPAWLHWWIGNSLGQLLVAPLVLAWLTPAKHKAAPLNPLELAVFAAGVAAVLLTANSKLVAGPLLLLASSYALLVWVGLRCDVRAVTGANLLVTIVIVGVGMLGDGYMSYLPVADRLFYVSFFLASGVLFSLLLFAMLEERRDMILRLTELASRDALTQVSNRRHFMEQAEREVASARRHGTPISLALLDVDHFKSINDTHGHVVGDQALQMLARCCETVLRTGDLVGRVGGEEFALLFRCSNSREARQAVQRLLDLVAEQSILAPDGREVRITFSAGVAEAGPQASLDAMYAAADQTLYEAKNAGRSRVRISGAAPEREREFPGGDVGLGSGGCSVAETA